MKKNLMISRFFATIAVFVCASATFAADIEISKLGAGKDAISLAGLRASGTQGKLFSQTLMSDLERSGWFKVDSSGAMRVTGTAEEAASTVQVSCSVAWAGGKGFQWSHAAGDEDTRRTAHLFADEIVRRTKGVPGIACTRILMVRRNGNKGSDLFMCDADGRNMKQVTHDHVYCVGPRWTADGKAAYYTSYLDGRPCVYRVAVDGGPRQKVSSYLGLNAGASVSPSGAELALILSFPGNPELFLMQLGSGTLTRLTRTQMAAEASPAWSPDGRQIVYTSDGTGRAQLYVMELATRQSRRITFRGSENLNPSWAKDGRIAYATCRGGPYQIAVWDARNSESSETVSDGASHEDPSWAPDSRHIVCSQRDGNNASIYILDTLGDTPIRLFPLSGEWVSPDWSER